MFVFDDPVQGVCDLLRDAITEATVSNRRPPPGTAGQHVQVGVDGNTVTYPIVSQLAVRVAVWASGPDAAHAAHDLAQRCQAVLLSSSTDQFPRFGPLAGPLAGTDPDSGDEFSFFTVTAVQRSVTV